MFSFSVRTPYIRTPYIGLRTLALVPKIRTYTSELSFSWFASAVFVAWIEMSPLLSCLAATTWGILSVLVASCFKVSLILLRNSSGVFRRSSAIDSGLPNLTMISLSLLLAMMVVGGVDGYVGGPPDLTLSA